jgi:hypothetical protein
MASERPQRRVRMLSSAGSSSGIGLQRPSKGVESNQHTMDEQRMLLTCVIFLTTLRVLEYSRSHDTVIGTDKEVVLRTVVVV